MNCPECGNPVELDAQFCPRCSARIHPPGLCQRFFSLFRSHPAPRRPTITIRKTVTINTADAEGHKHEYHSLDEVPAELRAEIEKLQSEATAKTISYSATDGVTDSIVTEKKLTVYKIRDASGVERTYHSLEELPPEIRAAIEQADQDKK